MKDSLQAKLLGSFMLVIVVMLVGTSLGLSAMIKEQVVAHRQQDLIDKGNELAKTVSSFMKGNNNPEHLTGLLGSVDSFIGSRVWVIDRSRQVIAISMPGRGVFGGAGHGPGWPGPMAMRGPGMQGGMLAMLGQLDPVYQGNVWVKTFDHPFYGEKMLVVAVPVTLADGSVGGAVVLNTPVTGINEFMHGIYLYAGVTGLVAIILALLVVARLTRGIIRPLKAMQETAAAMARGDYGEQVKVESGDEVGKLGLAINSLSRDLARNIAELERMEKLRRDFVANVSHELRTPLTVIRAYNQALMDGTIDDPEQVKKYQQSMQEETERLERLIKDLLDLSRLQSENVVGGEEKIPLAAVADTVVNMMRRQAGQKQVTLHFKAQEPSPCIMGHGDRITQLLFILLDNAVKYTPAGGSVTVSTAQEQDGVSLTVADTGIGIPAEDLPYIWERFYKVDKAHSRDDAGTGLGLAIASQIIALHRAKAEVTSIPGKGTSITVRFPLPGKQQ